jgi:hypothetical protein
MRAVPLGFAVAASFAFTLVFAADPVPDAKTAPDTKTAPDAKAAPDSAAATAGQKQPAAGQKEQASHQTTTAKLPNRSCIKTTGSRIPVKEGQCQSVPGRTYTQEELRNTGEPNTAEALRRLDPSFH